MSWLVGGQVVVMTISTLGFAILARTVGPTPFATFATLIFIFTAASLVTDLSPQGFLLVHGDGARQRSAAARSAAVSACLGGLVVLVLSSVVAPIITGSPVDLHVSALLAAAVGFQVLGQVPRARMLIDRRYTRAAVIDVAASFVSVAFAVFASFRAPGVWLLCAQLASYGFVRLVGMWVWQGASPISHGHTNGGPGMTGAIKYGLRVMPLNVSSYLSRALDSGLLPAILPAAAAAAYARSFQVVVAPISSIQLSVGGAVLERLAKSSREGTLSDASGQVWRVLLGVSALSSAAIAIASPILAALLFGDGWPMAQVFIAAMSCAIPSLFVAMFCSWHLQLVASGRRSARQLVMGLISPIGVLCCSQVWGTRGALSALVVLALVTPSLMIQSQFGMMPARARRLVVQTHIILAWFPSATAFILVSTTAGFWSFSNWR